MALFLVSLNFSWSTPRPQGTQKFWKEPGTLNHHTEKNRNAYTGLSCEWEIYLAYLTLIKGVIGRAVCVLSK